MSEERFLIWETEAEALADQAALDVQLGYPNSMGALHYFAVVLSGDVWLSPISDEFPSEYLPELTRHTRAEAEALGAEFPNVS
ncbi:MAG: hypothetical protein AB7F19_07765 [Candidatus Babeliales bacterium]